MTTGGARTWAACLFGACLALGCASPSLPRRPASSPTARRVGVEDLLTLPAEVEVTLYPPAVASDRVYGALLRKASALAAAYAGPKDLGTTALAALERTDEVDAALNEQGEVVVVLRGVPADLDVARVVDEAGRPVWRSLVSDLRRTFVEYAPAAAAASSEAPDAALFVLPERVWVVAAGGAKARVRELLVATDGALRFTDRVPPGAAPSRARGLAVLDIRGSALLRRDGRLRSGPLAPLGRSLLRASFELTPGAQGVLVTRLDYSDEADAAGAEQTARDIVRAFRRILEEREKDTSRTPSRPPPLSWLAAAGVERAGKEVTVRAPIPRPWLDAIARADVTDGATGSAAKGAVEDVPWDLWRRALPPPALTMPAQEPSQAGGSL